MNKREVTNPLVRREYTFKLRIAVDITKLPNISHSVASETAQIITDALTSSPAVKAIFPVFGGDERSIRLSIEQITER